MYREITQYFKITITTAKETIDITSDVIEGVRLEDEDGMILKLSFDMKEGLTNMDKLSRGMAIEMFGGDLNTNKQMFSGKIMELVPNFTDTGEVFIGVVCQGSEKTTLGRIEKDLVYPSNNHPKSWGKRNTTYSEIIVNLARDANYNIINSNISVSKDINATLKNPVRQKGKTDWSFMQQLADAIHCTLWVKRINGRDTLFLKDDGHLVNVISNKVFYYLARTHRSDFISIDREDPKLIKMESLTINLESSTGVIKQKQNPKTGKNEVVAEIPKDGASSTDESGQAVERWVLDEAKVRALSGDARKDLINSFIDGRVSWEADEPGGISAKPYFRLVTADESSRTGTNNNMVVEVSEDAPEVSENGVNTKNPTTEQTGSRTYKTVINESMVRDLSSEERTALMSRIVRRKTTESDSKYYTVVDTTPKPDKDDPTKEATPEPTGVAPKKVAAKPAKSDRGKRDSGFKIEATVFGRIDIETKVSHLLQGIGKYSGKYYAYRTIHTWGNNGWMITVTFVK